MSLFSHTHLHSFFKNKELNHFYFSVAIMTFGEALISVFVPIYLFRFGYSIHEVILFYSISSLSFVLFSYLGAKIVSQIGVKHSILWSTPLLILFYFGLNYLDGTNWLFFVLPILLSWRMILYNYSYHLNFITHANQKRLGREISALSAVAIAMNILAPFLGGILAAYSFSVLYFIGSIILFLGLVPLFLTHDQHEKFTFTAGNLIKSIFSKKEQGEMISFSGYAIESMIGKIIWPIFLIISLVSLEKTGLLIMLSAILSLIVLFIAGELTDRFNQIKLLRLGTILYLLGWVGRIFADTAYRILFIDSYKNIAEKVLHIPWDAHSYNLARQSGYFRFIVGREIIFNISRVAIMPILAIIFYLGYHPFIISFSLAAIASLGYMFLSKTKAA